MIGKSSLIKGYRKYVDGNLFDECTNSEAIVNAKIEDL